MTHEPNPPATSRPAYQAPTLKVFGAVTELTASGSRIGKEGNGNQDPGDPRKP